MKQTVKKSLCSLLVLIIVITSSLTALAVTSGDVNSDEKVNSIDALCVLSHAVGITPQKFNKAVADMNNDNKINSIDALMILNIAVGNLTTDTDSSGSLKNASEITDYYNKAINKVISSKAGFKKDRETVLHSLDGGALLKIQLVVDMVHNFLGVGTTQWDNTKGKQTNLCKASLTADDIKQATCVNNNGIYTITMTLRGSTNSANSSGSYDNSPLLRSGVYAGKGDKIAYDYKNSDNIYTAVNGVDNCKTDSVAENITNAKIIAVIDSKTGNLQSLTVSWDWSVELTNVKYTIVGIKQAKGNATTTVSLYDVRF